MRFLSGFFAAIVILALGAFALLATGSLDTSASVPPSRLEQKLARWALDRSVERRASQEAAGTIPTSPEGVRAGLAIYSEQCLFCHGAPGIDPSRAGQGLNPGAPDLSLSRVQRRSDAELYFLTSAGIRMTGMPAFSPTFSPEQVRQLVAALRRLPELTEEETALLKSRAPERTP